MLAESRHTGAIAVADADGRLLFAFGDVERPVFPRSAVKAMQAMPLVESGGADAFVAALAPAVRPDPTRRGPGTRHAKAQVCQVCRVLT